MYSTHCIKLVIAAATTPLVCGLALVMVGVVVRGCGRRRAATVFWITAACLVYLSAIAPVANALLAPLEERFPPLVDVQNLPSIRYVVVLGSGYSQREDIPITAALSPEGLARIAEGIRLMRLVPGTCLVVSGGATEGHRASAAGYAKFAVELGVAPGAIFMLDKPLDTSEEANSVVTLLGSAPFILVTSAYHMPRAMRLMRLVGAQPIAAPTGQLAPRHADFAAAGWIPSTHSLRKTEYALHEYLGLAIAN
jgi:uncharacterized SAM-binding protein YcdF (DUF218 family)